LSKSGTITINADRGTTGAYGIGHTSLGNVYIGSPNGGAWTASGDIILKYSNLVPAGLRGFKVKTTGAVTYESTTTSFSAAQTFPANANYILAESASSLTIGKTGNTANITIGSAQTVAGPVTIFGGTVALTGAINVGTNNLSIEANTALTQTAAITASGLELSGAGTVTLNNAGNNITTLAGGSTSSRLGSLSFTDASGGLTIGTVGSRSGIHTNSGVVLVETLNGNINLNESVTTNNTTANAVIINAGKNAAIGVSVGGDISVNGTPTISTGTGGISKLFSGLESNSEGLTSLVGGSANRRVNFDETTTTFTPALASNNAYAIYRTSLGTGDLTIVASGGDAINTTWVYANGVISTTASTVNINASVLVNYLASDTVIIEAGNVTINAAITSSNNHPFVINSNGIKTIAVSAALSLGGAITMNCNTFTLGNGINISTSTASDITINSNANFNTTGTTRRTISSAGGNIIIHADKDANGSGVLDLDYLTLNPGAGNTIIRGETANFSVANNTDKPYINGSGSFTFEPSDVSFGQDMHSTWFQIDQDNNGISGITIGKTGNTANILQNSTLSIAGPVNYYGGNITVSSNLTSTANGDIFLKGIGSFITTSATISKTAGTGTLLVQSHGRITTSTITASGTGVLNVVLWSDFDNSNNDGGSGFSGAMTTNGGHVWIGGSNSNGGSYTWNGLTVGDGPSIGSSNNNANALDLFSEVTTNGGDFFAWAGNGVNGGTNGIASNGTRIINTGSGDITFIAPSTSGTIQLISTGLISLVPNSDSYSSALTLGGTSSSGHFTINTSFYNSLRIDNVSDVGGLTIGRYSELLNNGSAVNLGNTSNITVSSAFSLGGALRLFGGAIALNANITTSNATTGDITINGTSISGTGNLALASGRTATLHVSTNSTYDGVISGSGSGLTKAGTGFLTLTNNHTYSGATTISAGDLQVGTGGSVTQASSGSISATSDVTVANGSKLIFSPNQNIVFAAPISGDGGVEIKGASGNYYSSFLTGTAATIASNSSVLEILTRITGGLMDGLQVASGNSQVTGAYAKSYNAATNTASLQFQQFDGQYTKVVFAVLSQSGTNVQIRANTSVYGGAAYRSNNHLGADMSTGSTAIGGLATASNGTGYGISRVYLSGKVNFTGALSYTGNTVLSNTVTSVTSPNTYSYTSKGTQEITDASSSFPSASTVVNNGLVILNRTTALTIASNMEGTEDILQVGAPITLTGTCTHSGITTIDLNKSLTIGDGASDGSITGNIVNYGTLTFARSDASLYPGIISGSGSLVKSGTGTHTLTGLNTYSGSTTIDGGKLVLERDIPVTSSTGFSGAGELVIQPSSTSFTNALNYPLSGFNVSSTIGGLTIGKLGNTANLTVTNATTANGPITFYSGTITLNANVTASNNGNIAFYSDNAIGGLSAQRDVSAAGLFSYIPQSNSFVSSVTYPITNLNVSCKGLVIGKTTNTSAVTFGTTTTIDGPITAYGSSVNINENVSSSSGGTISLFGNSLNFGTNKTVTSSGELIVAPQAVNTTIGLAGATGTLQLPATYFSSNFTDGFSNIQIGSDNQTGAISTNTFTLMDHMTFLTTDDLTLDGKPALGDNNVTLGNGITTINVGSPANYFQTNGNGKVFRNINNGTMLDFPIGNSAYNPLSIENNTGTSDIFSAKVIDAVYLNGVSGTTITSPVVNRTWDISKTTNNGGSGVDFIFNWNANEVVNGTLIDPKMNHYTGTVWEVPTVTATTFGTNALTVEGYTGSFSPFAISQGTSPLPVELTAFNANCTENGTTINWQTASEHNSAYFEVKKSRDGINWSNIETVAAAGNSTSLIDYAITDTEQITDVVYYRLDQVDQDGASKVFGPISAQCGEAVDFSAAVFPNPTSGEVAIEINNAFAQKVTIQICGSDGKAIVEAFYLIEAGTTQLPFNLNTLNAGIYSVKIQGESKTETVKLLVQ
jgi:autotransporter-associated beta strand protein